MLKEGGNGCDAHSSSFCVSTLLLHRPMVTQCVTAAVLFGVGDIVAQQAVERKGKRHDVSGHQPFMYYALILLIY